MPEIIYTLTKSGLSQKAEDYLTPAAGVLQFLLEEGRGTIVEIASSEGVPATEVQSVLRQLARLGYVTALQSEME